jgi:transposase
MRIMHKVCAGFDVHKKSVFVCLLKVGSDGDVTKEVRSFATTTRALLELLDWLVSESCTHVAMESTGVYWKPIYNLLEGAMDVSLVNAQHIKALPGRKTDVKDCEWIGDLLLHGLVKASFIPPREIRELRDLVRTRTTLIRDRTRQVNRIQKILEDANIKLGSVASDVLGVSGRAMLDRMVAGETDPSTLAALAKGRMRSKRDQLKEALWGRMRDHHRLLLRTHLKVIDSLDASVAELSEHIEACMVPFADARERLCTITGIGPQVATILISEMGADMQPWPTHQHAASWAGLCPGHHESAGKRKSSRTRKGNLWLRNALIQGAWAASHTQGTYLSAHFRRVCSRRGPKKAAMAVAHSILVRAYHLLKDETEYNELGGRYFDERQKQITTRRLIRRLESLGMKVTVEPQAA